MGKYFSSQQDDEEVVMVIRKHWFVLLPSISLSALVYLFGIFAVFVLPSMFPVFVEGFAYNAYVLIVSLLFLYNTTFIFSVLLLYYLNVGIITSEHIVEICQDSLFSRKISELGLEKIQDVTATQKGISQTMFNYGSVDVQTAGELPNFFFTHVPNPNQTAQKIMELEEEYAHKHGLRKPIEPSNTNPDGTPNNQTISGPNIEFPE